jgi:membrane protease YdiL (CAAX protease family)
MILALRLQPREELESLIGEPLKPYLQEVRSATTRNLPGFVGPLIVSLACALAFVTKLIAGSGLSQHELTSPSRFKLQIEWDVVLTLLVFAIVLLLERLPLASIGIRRPSIGNIALALLFFLVGEALNRLIRPWVAGAGLGVISIRTWDAAPLLNWTSIIAASVTEELVFRGYLINRVEALTGSVASAAIFSCLLFAFWHYPLWGMQGVVLAGAWGIVIAVFYVWRRDLPACIVTHFLTDTYRWK